MPEKAFVDRVLSAVDIPTLPKIVERLTQLLHRPDAGMREVAAELSKDPPLTAQVLRIANSAYYGLEEPILDIERAAMVLGMRTLYEVVLRASVMRAFEHVPQQGFSLDTLWKHSILTGQLCQTLVSRSSAKLGLGAGDLYTCGLLHDLGRIVLLDAHGERYVELLRKARAAGVNSDPLEAQQLGFSHPQVGAVLAYVWRLPTQLQDTIECHHGPESRLRGDATVALVALADEVARSMESGSTVPKAASFEAHPACKVAGIPLQALEELVEQAWQDYRQIEL
jgi:HD-like signal output (HDOD) protein